jgi:cell division protein FtsB
MQGLVSRIAIGVFGLLTVAMLLLAVFDEHGTLAVRERRLEKEKLQQEIDKAIEENRRYQQDIEDLRHNPKAIERKAYEEYKLVRPGEIILALPEAPEKKDQPAEKDPSKEQK